MLAVTGAGAAGLAIAAACGDGGGTSGQRTPGPGGNGDGEPVFGGRYRYAITGDWGTIDPLTSVAFAPGIFAYIYNCLIDQSRTQPGTFYMDLAEEFEQVDEETYNFTLRPDVTIAPNSLGIEERALDSSDCTAWMERIQADEAAVARAFTNQWLQSFDAPSATEFQIKTNGPYAYFLFRIGPPLGGTIPPKEFFEQDIDIKEQGVGAGPWAVIAPGSYSPTGGIVLRRNPNYYRMTEDGERLPYIDEIEAFRIDDRQARRTSFQDRQIDNYTAETAEEANELANQIQGALLNENPANTFIAFTMHPEKEPWTDERIRKAANFALNRQEYVDRIVGTDGGQINGLVHWSTGDFALPPEELEELQPYDPEMARQLIQDATGQDRISIRVIYPVSDIEFHDKHLPIWEQQMSDAGFDVQADPQDFTTWLANYQTLNYDASLSLNQIYETAEIPVDFHAADGPQGDRNFAIGIGGLYPEIEDAIQASKRVTDPAEHVELVHEVQRMIYERGPAFLPLMTWTSFDLFQPYVKNVPTGLGGAGLYFRNEMYIENA